MDPASAIPQVTIEDIGWIFLRVNGFPPVDPDTGIPAGERPVFAKMVDLFDLHDRWAEWGAKNKDKPASEYGRGLVQLLVEFGLPEMSQQCALMVIRRVIEQVALVKKNSSGPPVSPSSTASTPSV